MAIRIGINGFGRIGRNVFRIMCEREDFDVRLINDLSDAETLGHLLKYDSVFGRFEGTVSYDEKGLVVNDKGIRVTAEKDPGKLPWKDMEIDFVVESTGAFRKKSELEKHLSAGARKVLLTVPAQDKIDATIVLGVNDDQLKPSHRIISNASCTTNCLAPMAKVLHDAFGIRRGLMTTVHAYTNDQRVMDLVHKDLRRARAAAMNIIPTSTGAAKAIGEVIPALGGRMNGIALRVPVQDGSVVDLVCDLEKKVTEADVNSAMKAAADDEMKGILEYTEDPIVSSDIIKNPHSCVFDADSTMVLEETMVKVMGWYDNEWGYSNRVVDLIALASKK